MLPIGSLKIPCLKLVFGIIFRLYDQNKPMLTFNCHFSNLNNLKCMYTLCFINYKSIEFDAPIIVRN